jgi:HEAT repeat protein
MNLLRKGSLDEQISAALYFGEQKDARAVPVLIACLDNADSTLRSYAAWALGEIGDRAAIRPLIAVLQREDRLGDQLTSDRGAFADMYLALERLTGQSFGLDTARWVAYGKQLEKANGSPGGSHPEK